MTTIKDKIKPTLNTVGGRGYISLNLNYGFSVVEGGKLKYRPVKLMTGISIHPKHWEDRWFSPAWAKANRKEFKEFSDKIEEQTKKLVQVYDDLYEEGGKVKPTPEQIIDRFKGDSKKVERIRLVDFIHQYRKDLEAVGTQQKQRTAKKFHAVEVMVKLLEEGRTREPLSKWCKGKGPLYVHSFSAQDYRDYSALLDHVEGEPTRDYTRGGLAEVSFVEQAGYSASTKNKYQSDLSQIFRAAESDVYGHKLTINVSAMKKTAPESDLKPYLQPKELAVWLNARMKNPGEENVRRLFAVACLTASRYSDLEEILLAPIRQVKGENISFPALRYIQSKTGAKVCLPLFADLYDILSGERPYIITNQKLNDGIKEVAKKLGLDRLHYAVTTYADGRKEANEDPIFDELATHGGRRTLYTLLTGLLIPRPLITRCTGHKIPKKEGIDLAAYMSMTPEAAAETILIESELRSFRCPFRLVPEAVAAQIDGLRRKAS